VVSQCRRPRRCHCPDLGGLIQRGLGAPQDHAEAARWYRKAADQGFPGAQYNLGIAYANGLGVAQDHSEAVKWFRKAAYQDFPGAQYNLGLIYGAGRGAPQDLVQAHKWFNLAASHYPASDAEERDLATKHRDLIAARMTLAQVGEAEKLAGEWTRTK